jgi:Cd2+/Zn2+-exporting ATPase
VYVAEGSRYLGALYIRDEVKPDAKRALKEMKEEGVRQVIMLTGDRQSVGDAVAQELNVDHVYAELLPQIKVEKVEELLSELPLKAGKNAKLAFVGDGINDAPVLSRADIGIAMGALGSDAAIEAADIVLMTDDMQRLPQALEIAIRVRRIARQNIAIALGVKTIVLLLAAFGMAGMWAAVFADVGVALCCVVNAMRAMQ